MKTPIGTNESLENVLKAVTDEDFLEITKTLKSKIYNAIDYEFCPYNYSWFRNGPFESEKANAQNLDLYEYSRECYKLA